MKIVMVGNVIEEADHDQVLPGTIEQDPNTGDWLIMNNIIRFKSGPAIEITKDNHLIICGREVVGSWTEYDDDDYQDSLIEEYDGQKR